MQIVLKRFDPSKIDDTRICLMIGKRGTGKSVLAKDILYHRRKIASGICCSGTEDGNMWYQQFIPDSFIYNEFDKPAIERLIARQRSLRKKGISDNVFLILDDVMYDKKLFRDRVVRQLFMNGRHWLIFVVLLVQYCLDLSPDLRTNVDYVFILRDNIRQNRERLWKSFGGIFPTFEYFNCVMDTVTEDYGALVIDNTSKSNKIEDVAFWYKANPNRNFKMGSAALWRYHESRYNPDHDTPDGAKNETLQKKKAGIRVIKKR